MDHISSLSFISRHSHALCSLLIMKRVEHMVKAMFKIMHPLKSCILPWDCLKEDRLFSLLEEFGSHEILSLWDGWSPKSAGYNITTMKFCGNSKDNLPVLRVCVWVFVYTGLFGKVYACRFTEVRLCLKLYMMAKTTPAPGCFILCTYCGGKKMSFSIFSLFFSTGL